jgi:hypothetical protein
MAAVSEMIVRESFELHGFFVCQPRKYGAQTRRDEEDVDFLVLNPRAHVGSGERPFVLSSTDLSGIRCAIVAVKGWHTESFSVAFMSSTPELFRFLEPAAFQPADRAFGEDVKPTRILVVSSLPHTAEMREQSIQYLKAKGIDGVILFHTLLADLIAHVEASRNYQKSDLLQTIRLLKCYDFFKEPQLELFMPGRRKARSRPSGGKKAGAEPPGDSIDQAGGQTEL